MRARSRLCSTRWRKPRRSRLPRRCARVIAGRPHADRQYRAHGALPLEPDKTADGGAVLLLCRRRDRWRSCRPNGNRRITLESFGKTGRLQGGRQDGVAASSSGASKRGSTWPSPLTCRPCCSTGRASRSRPAELQVPEPGPGRSSSRSLPAGCAAPTSTSSTASFTQPKLPLVLGHEIVGHGAALGPGVDGFTLGDRVGVPWLG